MRTIGRTRGVTLVELLLGFSTLGILGCLVTVVVTNASRMSLRAVALLGTARTLFSFDELLRQELRDAADTDLIALNATQLTLRRAIGEAPICAMSGNSVTLATGAWSGTRAPEADRDLVLILVNADSGIWREAAITRVAAGLCPAGAASAWRLDFDVSITTALMARVMEPVKLVSYRSGAADWLGLAPADGSSSVQPFAGPLDPGAARFAVTSGALETSIRPHGSRDAALRVPLGTQP